MIGSDTIGAEVSETSGMIRSEEALRVGITVRESGRVRISKRVVTEQQTITVTVRREELVVEEFGPEEFAVGPVGDSGPDHSEGSLLDRSGTGPVLDLVLHEERVTTATVVVPTERVRVHLHRVAGSAVVSADLAREVVTAQVTDPSLAVLRTP